MMSPVMSPVMGPVSSPEPTLQAPTRRFGLVPDNPWARRSLAAALLAIALVGCSFEQLMLLDTVDLYFRTGSFERDFAEAVDFAEKVLGSAQP